MTFRSKMNDRVDFILLKESADYIGVADVAMDKMKHLVAVKRLKRGTISCIGECIEHDNAIVRPQAPPMHHKI